MPTQSRTLICTFVILLTACAQPFRPLQMYAGKQRLDSEVASIMNGTTRYGTEEVNAVLVGVDDRLCPGPETTSPGLPDNTCGNNTNVTAGTYRFKVVLQTSNRVSFNLHFSSNSWKRSAPFFTEPTAVEAGVLYRIIPTIDAKGFSAKLIPYCKSSNHEASTRAITAGASCI